MGNDNKGHFTSDGWIPGDDDWKTNLHDVDAELHEQRLEEERGVLVGSTDFPVREVPTFRKKLYRGPRPGYPSKAVGTEDLQHAIKILQKVKIGKIYCLLSDAEYLKYYGLNLVAHYLEHDFAVGVYPIPDFSTPRISLAVDLVKDMTHQMRTGCKVYIHCSAGQGRTGLALNCLAEYQNIMLNGKTKKGHVFATETGPQKNFVAVFRAHVTKQKKGPGKGKAKGKK